MMFTTFVELLYTEGSFLNVMLRAIPIVCKYGMDNFKRDILYFKAILEISMINKKI